MLGTATGSSPCQPVWSGVVESLKEASALSRRLLPTLTLSLLLALAAVSPADAEIREYQAYRCVGERAYRCGWLNVDTTNNKVRGYASISDLSSGDVGVVQIGTVRLYRASSSNGPWTEIASGNTNAGYEELYDQDRTSLGNCYTGEWYKVEYRWYWAEPGYSNNDVERSGIIKVTC